MLELAVSAQLQSWGMVEDVCASFGYFYQWRKTKRCQTFSTHRMQIAFEEPNVNFGA